jgi:hypothetical protein
MGSSETLAQLDRIMTEFFAPATSNDRKREIELLLANFSNQVEPQIRCPELHSNKNGSYLQLG